MPVRHLDETLLTQGRSVHSDGICAIRAAVDWSRQTEVCVQTTGRVHSPLRPALAVPRSVARPGLSLCLSQPRQQAESREAELPCITLLQLSLTEHHQTTECWRNRISSSSPIAAGAPLTQPRTSHCSPASWPTRRRHWLPCPLPAAVAAAIHFPSCCSRLHSLSFEPRPAVAR